MGPDITILRPAHFAALAACCLTGVPAQAQGQFNGAWTVTRSISATAGCGSPGAVFTIRIMNGAVSAPGGRGSIAASGAIRFPGVGNRFTGSLGSDSGSGTFTGKCDGTFSARRK